MNKIKQYYGVKFPFTENNDNGLFIDLNETVEDKALSDMLHVILTPKRSRLRKPDFGTDLVKFIWEPNDELLWENIKEEIKDSVKKYVQNVSLDDIVILRETNGEHNIVLSLKYSIIKGNKVSKNEVNIPI